MYENVILLSDQRVRRPDRGEGPFLEHYCVLHGAQLQVYEHKTSFSPPILSAQMLKVMLCLPEHQRVVVRIHMEDHKELYLQFQTPASVSHGTMHSNDFV